MSSVRVAVRVRPFNAREKERAAVLIVEMDGEGGTKLKDPSSGKLRDFGFDCSYWSHDGFTTNPET